jgi:hypothetical protein
VYNYAMVELAFAVGLQPPVTTFKYERIALPANPLVKTIYTTSPKGFRAVAMHPMMGDEAKRQLYADLVEYTMVPPLQAFAHIVATKMHLASLFNIAKLDPAGAGHARARSTKSSLSMPFTPGSSRRRPQG